MFEEAVYQLCNDIGTMVWKRWQPSEIDWLEVGL